MNRRICTAALIVACAAPVAAQEPAPSLAIVEVEATRYVADCDRRVLPSQQEVGEWMGQHNFSQVYASRQRLMAEIGRACQQDGIEQVRVVSRTTSAPRDLRLVAVADRRRR